MLLLLFFLFLVTLNMRSYTCQARAARRWRNVSLAFRGIISPWTHVVIPSLLPQPVLFILPPQYSETLIWGIKVNVLYITKIVVIRGRRIEAGWAEKKQMGGVEGLKQRGSPLSYTGGSGNE